MNDAYPRFGDFLNQTGRPMLYSCSWPDYLNDHVNFSYVGEKCNLWRMYRDIYSQWPIIEQIIEFYGDNAEVLQPIAGPGQWNVRSFLHNYSHAAVILSKLSRAALDIREGDLPAAIVIAFAGC
jgi:hypothetical protein